MWKNVFNPTLDRLSASGHILKLIRDQNHSIYGGLSNNNNNKRRLRFNSNSGGEDSCVKPLTFAHIRSSLIFLVCGLTCSAVVFACEISWSSSRKKKKEKEEEIGEENAGGGETGGILDIC